MNNLSDQTAIAVLRELRTAKGWTQGQLAERLGVTQGYVSRLFAKNHRPRPELKRRILELISQFPHSASMMDGGEFSARVAAAAQRSERFRALVAAALALMNENE